MKHILIIISLLFLTSPVIGDNHKGETLYRWGDPPNHKWMGFGKKEAHPVYKGQVKNGEPNGLGVMDYLDGVNYFGEWKNGKHHGKGTITFPYSYFKNLKKNVRNTKIKKKKYEGQWKAGKKHGKGTETYFYRNDAIGEKYEGQWKNGLRHGNGTLTLKNGYKYVGQWKDGLQNGQGELTQKFGEKYVGQFKDGLQNGKGTLTIKNGGKYVGQWKEGHQHGQGELTLKNGDKYVGQLYYGKAEGKGTFTWSNGDKYVGEWRNGKRNGHGEVTSKNGEKYVGQWKGGFPNGKGEATLKYGGKYVGQFKDGHRHGNGELTLKNGDKYVGDWKNGKEDGRGIHTSNRGDKYVGLWKSGKRNGQGTFTEFDGRKMVGKWKNGKPWNVIDFDQNGKKKNKWVEGVPEKPLSTSKEDTKHKPEIKGNIIGAKEPAEKSVISKLKIPKFSMPVLKPKEPNAPKFIKPDDPDFEKLLKILTPSSPEVPGIKPEVPGIKSTQDQRSNQIPIASYLQRKKLEQLAAEEYNLHIRSRIKPKFVSSSPNLFVRIRIKINETGKIVYHEIKDPSESTAFDKAAELAVRNAVLDPLPKALAENAPYIVVIRIQAPY